MTSKQHRLDIFQEHWMYSPLTKCVRWTENGCRTSHSIEERSSLLSKDIFFKGLIKATFFRKPYYCPSAGGPIKVDLLHQTCSYAHTKCHIKIISFDTLLPIVCIFFYCANDWMYFPLTRCVLPNWVVASPEQDTNLGIVTYRLHPVVSKILTFPRTHNPRVLIWGLVFQWI